jgi:hypothetical protein
LWGSSEVFPSHFSGTTCKGYFKVCDTSPLLPSSGGVSAKESRQRARRHPSPNDGLFRRTQILAAPLDDPPRLVTSDADSRNDEVRLLKRNARRNARAQAKRGKNPLHTTPAGPWCGCEQDQTVRHIIEECECYDDTRFMYLGVDFIRELRTFLRDPKLILKTVNLISC